VKNRLANIDSTLSASASPRQQLVEILEGYMADLESGIAQDQDALLAAHPELADELRPYLDSLRLLHGATRDMRAAQFTANGAGEEEARLHARQIGDYRIVREIGRGGMGIVYEAHQQSLNRKVALKVLPFAAVLDQRQIARFRNEAQAAAQLHHPHIVPVFAVGQELGVYYYAMQYIDGQSLEQAIGELRQTADQRAARSTRAAGALDGSTTTRQIEAATGRTSQRSIRHGDFFRTVARLGREAAEALEHAHQFGVVHRDIKPSNLLIDEHGKLWVTDFGLARMQAGGGVTLTGDVLGTLRYMSPEQASGQTALIDARTDVYALGVTLYELLTQQQAFPGDDRQNLLRRIVSEEPIPPRRVNPGVPVDLETIVLSAMSKSREERYPSAQALADDLARFLAGEPTLARRPTLVDRAAKWARRHRPLVALAACALILLTIVSAVAVALLAREQGHTSAALTQAKQNARAARESFERAERHFLQARGAVDQFGVRLADRLLEIPGAEAVRHEVLIETLNYYRKFMAEAADDPQLRHELALAHFKSGVIAAKLGAGSEAIREYQEASRLLGELAASQTSSDESRAQLAVTHNNLALLLAGRGNIAAAHDHYASAISIQRELVDRHSNEPVYASQLAESQANLGMLLDQTGDATQAERQLREAVSVLRPLAESLPGDPKYARNLAIACNNLSFVLRKRDADAAERVAREAIRILERLADKYPGQIQFQDDLALCSSNLAALLSRKGAYSEAIDWHTRSIALHEQLMRKAPAVVRHRSDLAISLNNLGVAYCRADRAPDADAVFARARELLTTLAGDYPNEFAYTGSIAALLNNQALALAGAGRHEEAIVSYRTAIETQRKCYERQPDSELMREALSKIYYNQGQSLQVAGRLNTAFEAALERRKLWDKNGERLVGVALELAQIAGDSTTAMDETVRRKLNDEVVATLRQAREAGWPREFDPAADERFAFLQDNPEFNELVSDLRSSSTASRKATN
jgi:serine/threonine protein kinase